MAMHEGNPKLKGSLKVSSRSLTRFRGLGFRVYSCAASPVPAEI